MQGQRGNGVVFAEIGVAPAQRKEIGADLPVSQKEHAGKAQQGEQRTALAGNDGDVLQCGGSGPHPGRPVAAQQAGDSAGVQHECGKQQQRKGNDGITFPYHVQGDGGIIHIARGRHVDALAQIEKEAEVKNIEQGQKAEQQRFNADKQAAEQAGAGIRGRALGLWPCPDKGQRQGEKYRPSGIELEADVQRAQDVIRSGDIRQKEIQQRQTRGKKDQDIDDEKKRKIGQRLPSDKPGAGERVSWAGIWRVHPFLVRPFEMLSMRRRSGSASPRMRIARCCFHVFRQPESGTAFIIVNSLPPS